MTPEALAAEATAALAAGTRLTLVRARGITLPPRFPRGELLCENQNGERCYSHDPARILRWLKDMDLVGTDLPR